MLIHNYIIVCILPPKIPNRNNIPVWTAYFSDLLYHNTIWLLPAMSPIIFVVISCWITLIIPQGIEGITGTWLIIVSVLPCSVPLVISEFSLLISILIIPMECRNCCIRSWDREYRSSILQCYPSSSSPVYHRGHQISKIWRQLRERRQKAPNRFTRLLTQYANATPISNTTINQLTMTDNFHLTHISNTTPNLILFNEERSPICR